MKTFATSSLADIALELPLRPVTDDLAGFTGRLSLSTGTEADYAAFAAEAFEINATASRAIGSGAEITRFLALAGSSDRREVALHLDILLALSLLNAAAILTVAIAPPHGLDDHAARRRVLADIVAAVGGDKTMAQAARKAFAHHGADEPIAVGGDLAPAKVPLLSRMPPYGPAMTGLEQGLSLTAFLRSLAPAERLVERASLQLDNADRFAKAMEEDELDHARLDRLQQAHLGASLLATANLARSCLVGAVTDDGRRTDARATKMLLRLRDGRLRDVLGFAIRMADRLAELRHMQREIAGTIRLV